MPIGEDALASYAFQIEIDGVALAQFKEVSGLSTEIQIIEHKENKIGSIPVVKKLPGSVKHADITLKRGKTTESSWWEWIKQVQEGKIDAARRNGSVVLFDYERGEKARWNFINAWPSKVSLGHLAAGGSEIAIEECTIVHEGLELA